MGQIKEITVFSIGDSLELSTWSNVPYFLTKSLEDKNIKINRVNLEENKTLRLIYKYSVFAFLKPVGVFGRRSTPLRTPLGHWAKWNPRPGRPRRFAPPKRAPPNLHLHFDLDVLDVGADVPCPRHWLSCFEQGSCAHGNFKATLQGGSARGEGYLKGLPDDAVSRSKCPEIHDLTRRMEVLLRR